MSSFLRQLKNRKFLGLGFDPNKLDPYYSYYNLGTRNSQNIKNMKKLVSSIYQTQRSFDIAIKEENKFERQPAHLNNAPTSTNYTKYLNFLQKAHQFGNKLDEQTFSKLRSFLLLYNGFLANNPQFANTEIIKLLMYIDFYVAKHSDFLRLVQNKIRNWESKLPALKEIHNYQNRIYTKKMKNREAEAAKMKKEMKRSRSKSQEKSKNNNSKSSKRLKKNNNRSITKSRSFINKFKKTFSALPFAFSIGTRPSKTTKSRAVVRGSKIRRKRTKFI